jgi:type II secretory pathway component GspD/PulD (secretin)
MRLLGPAHSCAVPDNYRHSCVGPTNQNVDSASARRFLLAAAAGLLIGPTANAQPALRARAAQPLRMPMLPLTTLAERPVAADLDNRTFTFTLPQPIAVKDLLMLFVRGTTLSMIPDPSIEGTFVGELKNVTIRQALDAVLPSLGLAYHIEGTLISVSRRPPETRIFDVDHLATLREGTSRTGTSERDDSFARVTSTTHSDLFGDITNGVRALLSPQAAFSVDRTAGVVEATDFPERLDRVSLYLDTILTRVHRQVQIDAKVIEIDLKDEVAGGIDWAALRAAMAQTNANEPAAPLRGLRVADMARFLAALGTQGTLSVLRSERITAFNNEPAIVAGDGFTLSVTPQIASEGVLMLSLAPVSTGVSRSASDTLARMADGETVVVPGFGRDVETREKKNVGAKGGWFGRQTVVGHRHTDTLIVLTATILSSVSAQ